MKTSKWCNENLNATPLKWNAAKSEIKEVLSASSWRELKEEISDVMYSVLCAFHTSTGISLPMVGAMTTVNKVRGRLVVWDAIFTANGLVFNRKYLVNGSNFNKREKIEAALNLARVH